MRKLLSLTLVFVLSGVPVAQAQALRGRAFFNPGTDITTPEKMAQEIEKCATDQTNARATCDMLVKSFNEAFDDIDDVKDYKELANYFRNETRVVPCPQTRTRVALVRGDRIDYHIRALREAEPCFFDDSVKRYVAAGCGQWTPDELSTFTANVDSPIAATGNVFAGEAGRDAANASGRRGSGTNWDVAKGVKVGAGVVAAGVGLWLLSKLLGAKQEVNVDTCVSVNSVPCR